MRPSGDSKHIACHDCDTLFDNPTMQEGERIVCPVCGATIFTFQPNSLHRAAAYVAASAVLFFVANIFPFLTLKQDLRQNQMLLYESVSGLVDQGYSYLAVAVAIFTLAAPSLLILSLLYLLLPLLRDRRLPGSTALCRLVSTARRWQMLDVYLLGVLVSLLKLGKLATLTLGTSFWAFVALIVCLTLSVSSIHIRDLWARLEQAR